MSIVDVPKWRLDAACRGMDISVFFPYDPTTKLRGGQGASQRAVKTCASCPVREECLAEEDSYELDIADIVGYRAGMTAKARRARSIALRAQRTGG